MLRTLRSRLLLSYVIVIGTVLSISALALLVLVVTPDVERALAAPVLQQLRTVQLATRRELAAELTQGARLPELQAAMAEQAQEFDVRLMLVDAERRRIIFDTGEGWDGITFNADNLERLFDLTGGDANAFAGRFRAPNDENWLVYGSPLASREIGRLQLVVARPQQPAFQFFRESFLTPLCQAGCVAFLLAILLAWLISRSVSRPLRDVAYAAEAVAQGDFGQELAISGPEEVRRLARSFNVMATQVQNTQQSQRDLVANVSHDLKTPLTSIQGWSQAVLDDMITTPEAQKRTARIIHDEAERMSRLVSQLLDLARLESGQLELRREPVALNELLRQVHAALQPRAREKEIYFDLDVEPVPPIVGDPDRLLQVFGNLAENGLKHTPAGGRVQIALRRTADRAVVAVRDNGKGIAPAELERIFERFYQVDKARAHAAGHDSSGLGLAIARELVEAHGGRITARSRVGEGSEFRVELPLRPSVGEITTLHG